MKAAVTRPLLLALLAAATSSQGTDPYSIGQPTDEEQYYLELINRARAEPTAEGQRLATSTDPDVLSAISFFQVNLTVMQAEFATMPVTPPLVFNAKLIQAARAHSQDMFDNVFQDHTGSGGSSAQQRMLAVGYTSNGSAENVYSFAENTFHGHAGFQIDWGADENGTDNGMQANRGHRLNIHSELREVGIGIVHGIKTADTTTVGPQLVTQKFANPSVNNQAFITGVAYYDLNGNDFYDPGEGIGGLTVNVVGSSFHAVTSNSGGYAVPVPTSNATRAVTFSGSSGLSGGGNATISGGANVKLDFAPTYTPPTLSGPVVTNLGQLSSHSFTAIGGATSHELRVVPDITVPVDSAENLSRVTTNTTGAYIPRSTTVKHAGTSSYRLAHPTPKSQNITYNTHFLVNAGGAISFRSRLRFATPGQLARVQISTNQGTAWDTVFSQAGTGGAGESNFQLRSVPLTAYEGKEVLLRFEYALLTGQSFFPGAEDELGWFIDDINFTNVRDVSTNMQIFPIAAGVSTATYTPATLGDFLLAVRPVISDRIWPFGPVFQVQVAEKLEVDLVVRHNGQKLIHHAAPVPAGSVIAGQNSQLTFEIHNAGDTLDLTGISAQVTGAAYSLRTPPAATLSPDEHTELIVEFSPTTEGPLTGMLQISSSDPDTPLFTIRLAGTGVIPPPVIHTPPTARLVQLGSSTTLSVSASGLGISYRWMKNGKLLPGANDENLTLSNVKTADAGLYIAQVSAGSHRINSSPARVGIITSPPALVQVKEGGNATLSAAVTLPRGTTPVFQWQRGGSDLTPADKPKGHNAPRLAIAKAGLADEATYRCRVSMTLPATEGGAVITGQTADSQLQIVFRPVMDDPGFGTDFVSESVDGKYTLSAVNGHTRFTASGLPPGVRLDAATGALTGKPTAARLDKDRNPIPYQVRLSASNLAGASESITVGWMVMPLPDGLAGPYELLVERQTALNQNMGGLISFTVTTTGRVSAALLERGKKLAFTSQLDVLPNGVGASLTADIKRARGQSNVTLSIPSFATPAALTGSLIENGTAQSADVTGWMCPFSSRSRTTLTGTYNLALNAPTGLESAQAPDGHSFATVTVAATGTARWAGIMADGTPFTAAHLLGLNLGAEAAQLHLHAPLYAGTGSVQGAVRVNDLPGVWEHVPSQGVDWRKLAQSKPVRSYTGGFGPLDLGVKGARFVRAAAGERLTGLAADMVLELRSGGLGASEFQCTATVSDKNALTLGAVTGLPVSSQITGLKVTLAAASGRLSGGFTLIENVGTPAQTRRTVKLAGTVIPVADEGGVGHFTLAENPGPGQRANATAIQSGRVILRQ